MLIYRQKKNILYFPAPWPVHLGGTLSVGSLVSPSKPRIITKQSSTLGDYTPARFLTAPPLTHICRAGSCVLDTALTNYYKRKQFSTSSSGFLLEDKICLSKKWMGLDTRPTGQLIASPLNYHSKPPEKWMPWCQKARWRLYFGKPVWSSPFRERDKMLLRIAMTCNHLW